MPEINLNILFGLCPLIFLAGFIDSIAGGGGLISLTAYMAFGIPGSYALGTNKFSSVIGCSVASANYIRTKNFDLKPLIPAFAFALLGSYIGSRCSLYISDQIFQMFLMIATPIIGVLVVLEKDYKESQKPHTTAFVILIAALVGVAVGFYDGFYGPGAGTFYQLGFVMLVGISLKKSCGNARLVNLASNLGALITFISNGRVLYQIAIPCAVFSIIGNFVGSRLAIKKDVKIVKPMMLVVVGMLLVKLVVDFFS